MQRIDRPSLILVLLAMFTLFAVLLSITDPNFGRAKGLFGRTVEATRGLNPTYMYAVVFITVFIANASIIISIPYPLIILIACQAGLDSILLIIVASLGAALGEITGYLVGLIGHKKLLNNEKVAANIRIIRQYAEKNRRYVYFLVFIYALTPLPDDLVMIPLGVIRFGFVESFIFCFLGKLLLIAIIVFASELIGGLLVSVGYSIWGDIIVIWMIALILYGITKVDLETIMGVVPTQGVVQNDR